MPTAIPTGIAEVELLLAAVSTSSGYPAMATKRSTKRVRSWMTQMAISATMLWTYLLAAASKLRFGGQRRESLMLTSTTPSIPMESNGHGSETEFGPGYPIFVNGGRQRLLARSDDLCRLHSYFSGTATAELKIDQWQMVRTDVQRLRQYVRDGYCWDLGHLSLAAKCSNLFALQYLIMQLPADLRHSAVRYCIDIAAEHGSKSTLRFLRCNYPDAVVHQQP